MYLQILCSNQCFFYVAALWLGILIICKIAAFDFSLYVECPYAPGLSIFQNRLLKYACILVFKNV